VVCGSVKIEPSHGFDECRRHHLDNKRGGLATNSKAKEGPCQATGGLSANQATCCND
jgi:hypothetical protein